MRARKLAPLAVAGPVVPEITNGFPRVPIDAFVKGGMREDANVLSAVHAQLTPEASGQNTPPSNFSPATVPRYLPKQCTLGKAVMLLPSMSNCKSKKKEAKKATGASRHIEAEQRRRNKINECLAGLRDIIPHTEKSNTAMFLAETTEYVLKLQRALKETNPELASTLGIPMDDNTPRGASCSDSEERGENNAAPASTAQPETVEAVFYATCSVSRETEERLQPGTPPACSANTCGEADRAATAGCASSKRTVQHQAASSSTSASDREEDDGREPSPQRPKTPTSSHAASSSVTSPLSQLIDSVINRAPGPVQAPPHQSNVIRPIPVRRSYGSAFSPVSPSPLHDISTARPPHDRQPPHTLPCKKRMRTDLYRSV